MTKLLIGDVEDRGGTFSPLLQILYAFGFKGVYFPVIFQAGTFRRVNGQLP